MHLSAEDLLSIAERILNRTSEVTVRSDTDLDLTEDSAVVAIVFSAAAVEAAANLAVLTPALLIENEAVRRPIARYLTQCARASLPGKLDFLFREHEGLRGFKSLRNDLKRLGRFRNRLVHSTPDYEVTLALPDDLGAGEVRQEDFEEINSLAISDRDRSALDQAQGYYEAACRFVAALDVSEPSGEGAGIAE